MTPSESGADVAEGVALAFRPQDLTVRQLLASHVAVLDELLSRGVVRTRNSPLGDLAETIALRAYGGTLAPNSEKSYDLTTPSGRRIQVKARLVNSADRRSKNFSAFRSFDFDDALFLLFDATSYDLIWARELTSETTRAIGRRVEHTNSSAIVVRNVAAAGLDVTTTVRSAYDSIDDVSPITS
ncbi:hypothetical protein HA387_00960 [Clavibacter michiganensis subsp. michiganensis]|uniref:DUF6998 domain-containing protein n=1 Tax=Clavibacter michiganensis TaxID=28447 RepID=UPI0018678A3F|nr:hypothetical protein [Clavibacter michiganensis]MBE3076996.1 hypothetical protein [Clavibacter michiganensis subsp. michiganensis]